MKANKRSVYQSIYTQLYKLLKLNPPPIAFQSLLHGYLGIRIKPDGVGFSPQLPADVTNLNVKHLNYRSAVLDIGFVCNNRDSHTKTAGVN